MDDIDALFIDQRQPAQPVPPGLSQRIDELQRNGCCDKMAWCSNGSLLYISDRGELEMSLLRYKESEGKWVQVDHKRSLVHEHMQKVFQGRQIAHISSNPHAVDIVISDVGGRMLVCAPFVDMNRLVTQKAYPGVDNEGNRLVGLHWLQPVQPKKPGAGEKIEKVPYFAAANRQGNKWTFGPSEALSVLGPVNPWGKSGFITVTALGKLQLFYNTPDMQWYHEEQHDLYKPEEPPPLLTHAAFAPSGINEAVMVAVDTGKNARVSRIRIDWNHAPGQQREHPQVKVDNLICFKMVSPCFESGLLNTLSGGSLSFIRLLYDRTQKYGEEVLPTIMAVYHNLPSGQTGFNAPLQTPFTTIAQYELRNAVPEIVDTFNTLSTKRNAKQTLKPQISLTPLEDERLEGIVLDVKEQQFGRSLGITYSDGKIEFRDRSLKLLTLDPSPEKVSTLTQIGFSFTAGESCLYNAFSSHACVRATMALDQRPKLSAIQVSVPLMEVADSAFTEKANAAFVLEFIGKGTTGDFVDIITAMRAFLDQLENEKAVGWKTSFLRSFAYSLQLHTKMNEQSLELMGYNQILQRFLSVQEALGHGSSDIVANGDMTSPRTASSHLAWILQNLRQQMTAILYMIKQPRPGQPHEFQRPEGSVALGQYGSWCGTLAEWAIGQILAANRQLGYPKDIPSLGFPPSQIGDHIPLSAQVAGALLILRLGRTCFKHCIYGVRNVGRQLENMPAHDMSAQWRPLEKAIKGRMFMFGEFIKFLDSCEDICTHIFGQIGTNGKDLSKEQKDQQREALRRTYEVETLIKGQCEGHLSLVLAQLVSLGAWSLRKSCEEGDIFFGDYSCLDPLPLADGGRITRPADIVWDGSRKVELGRRKITKRGSREDNGARQHDANGEKATTALTDEDVNRMDLDLHLNPGDELELSETRMTNGKEVPPLRICTRCGNVMENQAQQRTRQDFLGALTRSCYCGGVWFEMTRGSV